MSVQMQHGRPLAEAAGTPVGSTRASAPLSTKDRRSVFCVEVQRAAQDDPEVADALCSVCSFYPKQIGSRCFSCEARLGRGGAA